MTSRRDRSRIGRVFEIALYAVALAVPLVYFASRYPPLENWIGRIEWRNPIVFGESGADAGTADRTPTPPATNRVYRCVNGGEVVLSDRPCGNVVETREIGPGDINVMPSTAFTGQPAVPENVDCDALEQGLAALDRRRRDAPSDAALELERDAAWQRGRAAKCW
ncbi:MAG TPA: hypothetical protein VLT59_13400 [Steroidobacteraceae bacterium]|nr:hypothetical protein [Steroidobacteraceae bacterium]